MAILTSSRMPAAHWYTADGKPMHEVPTANGEDTRPTTLRDARKLNLIPSVTTIQRVLDKPALMRWRMQQAIASAIRNPKQPDESEEYWMKRVLAGAEEETERAADIGTKIHDALERATADEDYDPACRVYVEPVLDWLRDERIHIGARELVVVDLKAGFAGRVDVLFKQGRSYGVIDYKTRRTVAGRKTMPYDGQGMQLAAYAKAYYGLRRLPRIKALNVYISTTEPGRIEIYEHENLAAEYRAFEATAHLWRHLTQYDPRPFSGRTATARDAA